MNNLKTLTLICFGLSIITSCKKKDENKCVAGKGGNTTIVAYPKHHGKSVRPYNAYIKFNSKDAPASISGYDMTIVADTTEDHIELTSLKCGDYYIYMNGYDTSAKADVKGGLPYTVSESASGEINVNISVTE